MNTCESFAALLDAYVDGELAAGEMCRVREHLDGCDACQSYVDDALAIRAAFPDVEETEVPEGFADNVMAAIRAQAPAKPVTEVRKKRRRAAWVRTALPLAACCGLVILLAGGPLSSGRRAGNMAPRSMETESAGNDAAAPAAGEEFTEPELAAEDAMEPLEDPASSEEEWSKVENGFSPSSAPDPDAKLRITGAAPEDGAPAACGNEAVDIDSGDLDAPASPPAANQTPGGDRKPAEPREANKAAEGTGGPAGEDGIAVTSSEAGLAAEENPEFAPAVAAAQDAGDEGWVEYGNVVFASVVYLSKDDVGDALEACEGKPYSSAQHPEDGVTGTGYALEPEDFERILDELAVPLTPNRNPDCTTELCCIVVKEP